jgi:hypothetical protein
MRVLEPLNALCEMPILQDYIVYIYWFLMSVIVWPVCSLVIFISDHFSGHMWT